MVNTSNIVRKMNIYHQFNIGDEYTITLYKLLIETFSGLDIITKDNGDIFFKRDAKTIMSYIKYDEHLYVSKETWKSLSKLLCPLEEDLLLVSTTNYGRIQEAIQYAINLLYPSSKEYTFICHWV